MNRSFKVRYNPNIYHDLQRAIDHYRRETGNDELRIRLVKSVKLHLKKLRTAALHYQVGYDDIRLLPIFPFSFMAHYICKDKMPSTPARPW